MKKILVVIFVLVSIILIFIGGYVFIRGKMPQKTDTGGYVEVPNENVFYAEPPSVEIEEEQPVVEETRGMTSSIGTSAGGRPITAYHFGTGDSELVFVGGLHGGYEWNTVLVAYEMVDYLKENLALVPENYTVTVIPTLNPDGLYAVTGKEGRFAKSDILELTDTVPGRFNANNVDLNRNFDCDWKAKATWQDKEVSGGSAAFSEPEAQAFKSYVEEYDPVAAVVWYSAAGGVYSSNCHNGVLPETVALTNLYADASGYPAYEEFNYYAITGDMVNWLAKLGTPAISVLLTNHEDTEWDKNKAGIDAVLKKYSN
jgi:Zinc carboxypeptidase